MIEESKNPIIWIYELKKVSGFNSEYSEIFRTIYNKNCIKLTIPIRKDSDYAEENLTLRIFSDSEEKKFIGLSTGGLLKKTEPIFIKSLESGGQEQMNETEAPDLLDFINKYKDIFESQRDLKERFKDYF